MANCDNYKPMLAQELKNKIQGSLHNSICLAAIDYSLLPATHCSIIIERKEVLHAQLAAALSDRGNSNSNSNSNDTAKRTISLA